MGENWLGFETKAIRVMNSLQLKFHNHQIQTIFTMNFLPLNLFWLSLRVYMGKFSNKYDWHLLGRLYILLSVLLSCSLPAWLHLNIQFWPGWKRIKKSSFKLDRFMCSFTCLYWSVPWYQHSSKEDFQIYVKYILDYSCVDAVWRGVVVEMEHMLNMWNINSSYLSPKT